MNRRTFVGALTGVLAVFGLARGQDKEPPQLHLEDSGSLDSPSSLTWATSVCPVKLCAVCGRDLPNCETVATSVLVDKEAKSMGEVYPELEPGRNYIVCLVCMLRAYGVRV